MQFSEIKEALPKIGYEKIKDLLDSLKYRFNKDISQQQLDEICIGWTFHNAMNDFDFRSYPVPDEELKKWVSMDFRVRDRLPEDVQNTLKEKYLTWRSELGYIHNDNKSKYHWLLRMKKYYTFIKDEHKLSVISELVSKFETRFRLNWRSDIDKC